MKQTQIGNSHLENCRKNTKKIKNILESNDSKLLDLIPLLEKLIKIYPRKGFLTVKSKCSDGKGFSEFVPRE